MTIDDSETEIGADDLSREVHAVALKLERIADDAGRMADQVRARLDRLEMALRDQRSGDKRLSIASSISPSH